MKKISLALVLVSLFFVLMFSSCAKSTLTAVATAVPTYSYSDLVSVPGGTFTQTDGTNWFDHTISDFKIGKYKVTYDLWYTVKTWALSNGYTFANLGKEGSDGAIGVTPTSAKYEPVADVNWRDAIVWCNAYSVMSSLTPVYCTDAGYMTPIKTSTNSSSINSAAGSEDNPYVSWSANGYRLLTEGEWQYAASWKGTDSSNGAVQYGTSGTYWTPYNYASGATADYNDVTATSAVAWYSVNSGNVTHNVGGKNANALGIYDMSGNLYEWCWDWFGGYPGPSTNYKGQESSTVRLIRGHCYSTGAVGMQIGYRDGQVPKFAGDGDNSVIGFRIARTN